MWRSNGNEVEKVIKYLKLNKKSRQQVTKAKWHEQIKQLQKFSSSENGENVGFARLLYSTWLYKGWKSDLRDFYICAKV